MHLSLLQHPSGGLFYVLHGISEPPVVLATIHLEYSGKHKQIIDNVMLAFNHAESLAHDQPTNNVAKFTLPYSNPDKGESK